ncbi:sigma-70 family RNA polymerase sigma factor (plasmid) [Pontibacillus sp. ALD_SL1]|uniref:RNA polymerase sigma factor n=1 Tax=Pontibacillus sp. ALD_SL1 TaxID=2777185 RepID=UPI001A961092|nr:sigma-70 family RNA polymerase sigma factor [Pontibacillus sp. ALD_SL1]QST02098.1 sigma-70 family RNA polymerase sigma factor [Pontibacillus sp. ALD_SL1]
MNPKIIRKIQKGNVSAFQDLYDDYADQAFRIALSIVRDRETAKDVTQETFIRVCRSIDSFDPTKPFDPWFFRILKNESLRSLKQKEPTSLTDSFKDQKGEMDEENLMFDLVHSTLDEPYLTTFLLKYVEGFSEKEVASITEENVSTVKNRLLKGRELLRNAYKRLKGREFHA